MPIFPDTVHNRKATLSGSISPRRVEDAGVGLFRLEDVTTADDYPGLARIAAPLATPVAGGEYVWGIVPFRHMVEARSVDIVMIDLVRVGRICPSGLVPAVSASTFATSASIWPTATT